MLEGYRDQLKKELAGVEYRMMLYLGRDNMRLFRLKGSQEPLYRHIIRFCRASGKNNLSRVLHIEETRDSLPCVLKPLAGFLSVGVHAGSVPEDGR